MTIELYRVGGCVRDQLLGVESKDIDYTVLAESYDHMRSALLDMGVEFWLETPQYYTIRGRVPKDGGKFPDQGVDGKTVDFVFARKESGYTDGRHPDKVEPGTLRDDLARRDFTVNALAQGVDGEIVDYFNGRADLDCRVLRAVGTAHDRLTEDPLRALRAVRFAVTKDMSLDGPLCDALDSEWLPRLVAKVNPERRREELLKAFKADTLKTLDLLVFAFPLLGRAAFSDGLWLKPTLEER